MIDADDRALMLESVRAALADVDRDAPIDEVLAKLGWLDMLAAEPADAIEVVFSALGATDRAATAIDDVIVSALGVEPRADLAVLLPRFAAWSPPGALDANELDAQGLATARAARARAMLVICGMESEPWSVTIAPAAAELRAVRGIDPDAGFRVVHARCRAVGAARIEPAAWQAAVALGRRAIAYQIAGASRAMLSLARSHAMTRIQFGRPIARFQAVRHRLADALIAVEALEASLTAAREEPTAETAALAKAVAGRTARTVATHCQQVLAGVGFTTEHSFHRFLKRTIALEGLLGSSNEIALDLGRRLLASRRVPTLIEL